MIEERIAGGPEQYQSEKEKYFQGAWSGQPFKNKVRDGATLNPLPRFVLRSDVCLLGDNSGENSTCSVPVFVWDARVYGHTTTYSHA